MNKLVDAAIVAALLLASIPDLPAQATPASADDSHGDRPC